VRILITKIEKGGRGESPGKDAHEPRVHYLLSLLPCSCLGLLRCWWWWKWCWFPSTAMSRRVSERLEAGTRGTHQGREGGRASVLIREREVMQRAREALGVSSPSALHQPKRRKEDLNTRSWRRGRTAGQSQSRLTTLPLICIDSGTQSRAAPRTWEQSERIHKNNTEDPNPSALNNSRGRSRKLIVANMFSGKTKSR